MIHAYIANASLCNIPFLFLCFLCHPYIFTIFVEFFYCSLDMIQLTHITFVNKSHSFTNTFVKVLHSMVYVSVNP